MIPPSRYKRLRHGTYGHNILKLSRYKRLRHGFGHNILKLSRYKRLRHGTYGHNILKLSRYKRLRHGFGHNILKLSRYKRLRHGFGHNILKLSYHLYGEPEAITSDLDVMQQSVSLEIHGMPLTYSGLVRICGSIAFTLIMALLIPNSG
jgi:hypothetical protein